MLQMNHSDSDKVKNKKTRNDFRFGKILGEGSYSTVVIAQEIETSDLFAIKVILKRHIIKEKKIQYVTREKEILSMLKHELFVKLHATFQDQNYLYYVLTFAQRGEILAYISKLGGFNLETTTFYSAEIILALEYLHSLNIVHRDIKPENILLSKDYHVRITDFGTAKLLGSEDNDASSSNSNARASSFVGTAQYVSPELLQDKTICASSDIWSLGVVIFQMVANAWPFSGSNDYQIFQKILKLEYDFPIMFFGDIKDLVSSLLVLDPVKRLGPLHPDGYEGLKKHKCFSTIDWANLTSSVPPKQILDLQEPETASEELFKDVFDTGDKYFDLLEISIDSKLNDKSPMGSTRDVINIFTATSSSIFDTGDQWSQFVDGAQIYKVSLVLKQKTKFHRKLSRILIACEGPRLIYIDPSKKEVRGEIEWNENLKVVVKSFRDFRIDTGSRTYFFQDLKSDSASWVSTIDTLHKKYFNSTIM